MSEQRVQTRKTIGILGGMGPAATANFYQRIIAATDASCDQEHLHLLIDSCPQTPDRTAFLLGAGEDPTPTLLKMALCLECAGAELLIIACNTAHAFLENVSSVVTVPIIDWVEEAAAGVVASLPSLQRIGLLATTGTIESRVYQRAFATHDIQTTTPDPLLQEQLMSIIYGPYGIKSGKKENTNSESMRNIITSFLRQTDVQAILLACTELSLLDTIHFKLLSLPLFDASQLVAERLIVRAGGRLKSYDSRFC